MGKLDTHTGEIRLQVLVCTYGNAGMEGFMATRPPRVSGVEYVVSWQLPDGEEPAKGMLSPRGDIHVYPCREKGLSRNRNRVMGLASAPLCLHADDDVCLLPEALSGLIRLFDEHPECDVVCCRYTCGGRFMKPYPDALVPLRDAPNGWYANSFEIAYRRGSAAGRTPFNENFGVNAPLFRSGEEDLWLCDSCRGGASVYVAPITLGAHDHDSTAERHAASGWFIMTQGAVHSHLHPFTWPVRTLTHALRQHRVSPWRYWLLTLRGALAAHRDRVFRRADC